MPANTPTITPDTETVAAARLRVTIGRLARRLRPTAAGGAAELTPTRATVLLDVVRRGPLRLADVARADGINPTMLSRVIAHLVDNGLVERTSDARDRRSAWVAPTAEGRRLARQMRRERTEAVDRALNELPADQREALVRALPALESLAEELAGGDCIR